MRIMQRYFLRIDETVRVNKLIYLNMCFIYVGRIGELRLFADSFTKDNILLEKKDLPFSLSRRNI